MKIPNTTWKIRKGKDWFEESASDYFSGKRSLVVSLPGAFTPIWSEMQLPGLEALYDDYKEKGIDEVYCLSVNDSFVMNAWAKHHKIDKVKVIPDGNGEFTRKMGMLVEKNNLGFGYRSWRYAAIVDDCKILGSFVEQGFEDNCQDDPYEMSSPQNILKFLEENSKVAV